MLCLYIKQYYNTQNLVLNIHSLSHLADDVQNMKCSLSNYTAFPFKKLLGKMKKMLRNGNRLCRRQHELLYVVTKKVTLPQTVMILKTCFSESCGRTPIKKIKYKKTILTCKKSNKVVSLTNKDIIKIKTMYSIPQNGRKKDIILTGYKLKIVKPIFKYPYNSGKLDMWQLKLKSKLHVHSGPFLVKWSS